jgi:hypothetical protein
MAEFREDHYDVNGIDLLPGVGHLIFDESREAIDTVGDFVAAGVAA